MSVGGVVMFASVRLPTGSWLFSCLFVSLACFIPNSLRAGEPATAKEVELIKNLPYFDGPTADPIKHKLDLYLPPGRRDYPTLLFVHGGAWSHGDKNFWFDLYGRLGKAFAQQGIGVAVINYRLAPGNKHPEQARDVAKAIAWVHKNIARYGGKPGELFIAGHSAGGHLVALVSSDEQYLKDVGMDPSAIRGVIPISGVYDVRPREMLFNMVFGTSPEERTKASPITHVKAGLPPFLLLHGDHELPHCDAPCACKFFDKLKEYHNTCRILPISQRDHMSIIARIIDPTDPGHEAILAFIRTARP